MSGTDGQRKSDNDTSDSQRPRMSTEGESQRRSTLVSQLLSSLNEGGSREEHSRSPFRDEWDLQNLSLHHSNMRRPWHRRPPSPGLEWNKVYTELNIRRGRVLVVDYVKQELSKNGMRKVAAQEINNLEGLEGLYKNEKRRDEAVLRLFHVQNAPWALSFFFKKLNLKPNELVGPDYGDYVNIEPRHYDRRGRKKLLKGKLFPAQHDPWRNISRTGFTIDYLKMYKVNDPSRQPDEDPYGRFMEMNCYNEEDIPRYGYDVYPQRLSCYIQHKEDDNVERPLDPQMKGPYGKYPAPIEDMDNGNVILILENSKTCSIQDTCIPARREWESRWRRLPFYLVYENQDISNDDDLAVQCMRLILQDVWSALQLSWEKFLDIADHHIAILEEKIYEQPADESRADEIWLNSSNWLKVERLMLTHSNIIEQLNTNLRELVDSAADSPWLDAGTQTFKTLTTRVQENLIRPTDSLSDLMYKSVGIRDARHSLELSYSMWRLSWITFVRFTFFCYIKIYA